MNKTTIKNFLKEEEGMGTVEVVLIVVVLVGLVVVFKENIAGIVTKALDKATTDSDGIIG